MKQEQFQLIDGTYSPADAHELLMTLITDKIKFHNLHIHSTKERFNSDTKHSEERIKALSEVKSSIASMMKLANENNQELTISGVVSIEFKSKN